MKPKDVAVPLLSILASENIWWFTQVLRSLFRTTRVNVEDEESGGGESDRGYCEPRVGVLEDGTYPRGLWRPVSEKGSKYSV